MCRGLTDDCNYLDLFSELIGVSLSHPVPILHLPRRTPDLDEHKPSHEGKRRNDRHDYPKKTASNDGLAKTAE